MKDWNNNFMYSLSSQFPKQNSKSAHRKYTEVIDPQVSVRELSASVLLLKKKNPSKTAYNFVLLQLIIYLNHAHLLGIQLF